MDDNFKNSAFGEAFAEMDISDLPEAVAAIRSNDEQISGGRTIVNAKSNHLFTGQFEKSDMDDFASLWLQYKRDLKFPIKSNLMQKARSMINNYHGEVCPIEVMLYTSNLIANMFVNKRLMLDVADVVCEIFRINENYLKSIRHILTVWKWEQSISVCEIAAGRIGDVELLRYISDNFSEQEGTRYGCFCALITSKNDEFVPAILKMVHDLSGYDVDKQIGNLFMKNFGTNFPEHLSNLDIEMFADSKSYVQDMIKRMVDPKRNDNMTNNYRNSLDKDSRNFIAQTALDRVIRADRLATSSPYDAINVLKMASSNEISEQLLTSLNLRGKPVQRIKDIPAAVIFNYFGTVNYPQALQQFYDAQPADELYAAERVALFKHDKISSAAIVKDFLTETRPDQVKMYLNGFWGLGEKIPAFRMSTVNFFNSELSDGVLSTAITNYHKMIQRYRQLYDPQVGETIKTWFGFETPSGRIRLRLKDQNTCLSIIENIISLMNYEKYESFLYYVAAEGWNFAPTISSFAKRIILTKIPAEKPKL